MICESLVTSGPQSEAWSLATAVRPLQISERPAVSSSPTQEKLHLLSLGLAM